MDKHLLCLIKIGVTEAVFWRIFVLFPAHFCALSLNIAKLFVWAIFFTYLVVLNDIVVWILVDIFAKIDLKRALTEQKLRIRFGHIREIIWSISVSFSVFFLF